MSMAAPAGSYQELAERFIQQPEDVYERRHTLFQALREAMVERADAVDRAYEIASQHDASGDQVRDRRDEIVARWHGNGVVLAHDRYGLMYFWACDPQYTALDVVTGRAPSAAMEAMADIVHRAMGKLLP